MAIGISINYDIPKQCKILFTQFPLFILETRANEHTYFYLDNRNDIEFEQMHALRLEFTSLQSLDTKRFPTSAISISPSLYLSFPFLIPQGIKKL
ncbi:CLUMA_CG003296, isoform A [Clunio marinus]|uniref:CLUMA_CG003296, isoform A n=1 Tax=Clunio marinus TaxID=568069 RepID=A0A1J1HQC0_9DIPT|nr:CLUMA_CG003296, isoform A [Clunio marinus]